MPSEKGDNAHVTALRHRLLGPSAAKRSERAKRLSPALKIKSRGRRRTRISLNEAPKSVSDDEGRGEAEDTAPPQQTGDRVTGQGGNDEIQDLELARDITPPTPTTVLCDGLLPPPGLYERPLTPPLPDSLFEHTASLSPERNQAPSPLPMTDNLCALDALTSASPGCQSECSGGLSAASKRCPDPIQSCEEAVDNTLEDLPPVLLYSSSSSIDTEDFERKLTPPRSSLTPEAEAREVEPNASPNPIAPSSPIETGPVGTATLVDQSQRQPDDELEIATLKRQLETTHQAHIAELDGRNHRIAQLEILLERNEADLQLTRQAVARYGPQLRRLSQDLDDKDGVIAEHGTQLRQSNAEVQRLNVTLIKANHGIRQLQERSEKELEDKDRRVAQLKAQLDRHQINSKTETRRLERDLAKSKEELEAVTTTSKTQAGKIARFEVKLDELRRTIEDREQETKSLRGQLESKEGEVAAALHGAKAMDAKVGKRNKQLEETINRLEDTIAKRDQLTHEQRQTILKRDEAIREYQLGQKASDHATAELRVKALWQDDKITRLETLLEQRRLALQEKDRAIEGYTADVVKKCTDLASAKAKIVELEEEQRQQEVFGKADRATAEAALEQAREAGFVAGQETQEELLAGVRAQYAELYQKTLEQEKEDQDLIDDFARRDLYLHQNPPIYFACPAEEVISNRLDELEAKKAENRWLRKRLGLGMAARLGGPDDVDCHKKRPRQMNQEKSAQPAELGTRGDPVLSIRPHDRSSRPTTSSRKRARSADRAAGPSRHNDRRRLHTDHPPDRDITPNGQLPSPPPTAPPPSTCTAGVSEAETISRYRATFSSRGYPSHTEDTISGFFITRKIWDWMAFKELGWSFGGADLIVPWTAKRYVVVEGRCGRCVEQKRPCIRELGHIESECLTCKLACSAA